MNLQVNAHIDNGIARIVVAGEVDVSNAEALRVETEGAIADSAVATVVVDMAEVPYIDSTGIGVLVGSAHKSKDAEKGFSVQNVQPNVLRILGLLGVDEVLELKKIDN